MCFNWMLQRPSAAFGEAVRKARARMGLSGPFLALQFRTFKNGKYFHQFKRSHEDGSLWSQLDCIIGDWKKQHPGAKVPRTIFFTTDKPKLFTPKVVQAKLKKYGKVVVNSGGYVAWPVLFWVSRMLTVIADTNRLANLGPERGGRCHKRLSTGTC